MTRHILQEALFRGTKDTRAANYSWLYEGVARHGALEWTLHSEDTKGLIRIVSAFEVPRSENEIPLFELRGYICDREYRYSEFITFSGEIPSKSILQDLVGQLYSAVESLTEDDLRDTPTR
ncbi:hypothetical protein [Streptomyces boncukensis]|uniref:Uncharacterized protein n=1 Tax=Streptomyces boncukensis TaxID=2711219 RepID=A0A6G4WYQ5_9ACTN|nr:hypothetical protein [Streptomyces boncukensis]NGO69654.1 hypothetical protein [Streptomyces boncukensis]